MPMEALPFSGSKGIYLYFAAASMVRSSTATCIVAISVNVVQKKKVNVGKHLIRHWHGQS